MDEIEAAVLAQAIALGIKETVRRPRPLDANGLRRSGFSFPSGHATVTFAAATVLQQHLGYRHEFRLRRVRRPPALQRLRPGLGRR